MIEWYLVLPVVGSLILLFAFGFAIACSRGFREALMGLGGEQGKFSLLNIFSVEGAGAIIIVGILIGGGIVYPLTNISELRDAEDRIAELRRTGLELKGARDEVAKLTTKLEQLKNPDQWQIEGQIELPRGWRKQAAKSDRRIEEYFSSRERADEFWNQGSWTLVPIDRLPITTEVRSGKQNFEHARVRIHVRVPKDAKLPDWIKQIKYENGLFDLQTEMIFDAEHVENFKEQGPKLIVYTPLKLRSMFTNIDQNAGAKP